jgi:hypothetical protein
MVGSEPVRGQDKKPDEIKPQDLAKKVAAAREKGLDWLTKNQAKDGYWTKPYTIGVTAMACLAYLSAADEPFTGERGKALVKGLQFLLDNQKDGKFPTQGKVLKRGFTARALPRWPWPRRMAAHFVARSSPTSTPRKSAP